MAVVVVVSAGGGDTVRVVLAVVLACGAGVWCWSVVLACGAGVWCWRVVLAAAAAVEDSDTDDNNAGLPFVAGLREGEIHGLRQGDAIPRTAHGRY